MRIRRLLIVAAVLAVIAGLGASILSLFDEPACPNGADAPVPVLVARQLIPEGTSGSAIVNRREYVHAVIPCRDRKAGVLADPAELLGNVTVIDVFPGQQLTRADISAR